MLKYVAAALLASSFVVSTAVAAPPYDMHRGHDRDHHSRSDRHDRDRHDHDRHHSRYHAGGHYRSAPHGWHRYHSRPGDWRTRGCILVGPLWFCP